MKTEEMTNLQLVTVAVALLEGDLKYVDMEDIAIQVDKLARGRFNWRKYPERIDTVTVVNSLQDAKKHKNGGMLIGSNSRGWMLSPSGEKFVESVDISRLGFSCQWRNRKESIVEKKEVECNRLRRTNAYQSTLDGDLDRLTIDDFRQFARINNYFQTKARARRIAIVDNAVDGEEDLLEIWNYMKNAFPEEYK